MSKMTHNLAQRKLDISGAWVPRTNLSQASLVGANFSNADLSNAVLCGADMKGAILEGTILKGADLTGVKNLTKEQLANAVLDDETILPDYLQ